MSELFGEKGGSGGDLLARLHDQSQTAVDRVGGIWTMLDVVGLEIGGRITLLSFLGCHLCAQGYLMGIPVVYWCAPDAICVLL